MAKFHLHFFFPLLSNQFNYNERVKLLNIDIFPLLFAEMLRVVKMITEHENHSYLFKQLFLFKMFNQ